MTQAPARIAVETPPPRAGSRVAIIGGGILGMELARQLRLQGRDVILFEAAPHFGGLADAWSVGDIAWDRHYHVTLLSDLRLRSLLEELNLAGDLQFRETRTGFYTDGRLHSMSNTLEFLRFPPLGLLDKLRLGGTIFFASKLRDWRRLEAIPVLDWLRRWSGRRTTRLIWQPLLRAKLGEQHEQASAAFLWAIIARMYAARKSGLKKEQFGYVSGGYARIIEAFASRLAELDVELRPGSRVQRLEQDSRCWRVVTDNGDDAFDCVVATVASPVLDRLVPQLPAAERAAHRGIRYQGIVCASLVLKQPLADFYVTNITDDWVPFTAVIEMTALVDPADFSGRRLVYLPKYVAPDDPLFEESDDSIRERFLAALERMYPHFRRDQVEAFRLSRVRHVLAISTLNYSRHLPPMASSLPGLFAVNSAQICNGTLNVNETLLLADRALADVLAAVPR